ARMRFDEFGDRLGVDEWNVTAEDDHGRGGINVLRGGSYGAAGAIGLWLYGKLYLLRQDLSQRMRGRVHHDDAIGTGSQCGPYGPHHHRNATQVMQHLGRGRAHTRALSCGEDQEGRGGGHRQTVGGMEKTCSQTRESPALGPLAWIAPSVP